MRRAIGLLVLALAALAYGRSESVARDEKGTVVDLDGLKSAAPAEWKEEAPANKMRFVQFRLPKAKGDKDDAELIIFRNAGGAAKDNVERWKKQFQPPEGKKIDDVSKVTEIKIGGLDATRLEVEGTYLFNPRPFDPSSKPEARPEYKMVAIHFDGPKNLYHIKLVGPAKTIEQYQKGFDEWVKAFK
jgi:hypothetical protein